MLRCQHGAAEPHAVVPEDEDGNQVCDGQKLIASVAARYLTEIAHEGKQHNVVIFAYVAHNKFTRE